MTTAPENRGGFRPTAPQNNPANISATGGNGQSGATQAMQRIPGQPWGQGQVTEDIGRSAPLAGNPTAMSAMLGAGGGTPLPGLSDATNLPDQDVTHGNDMSNMPMPAMATPEADSALQFIQAMYLQDPTNQDLRYILETASNEGRM